MAFVASPQNGWLFWNVDGGPRMPDEAVRPAGLNGLAALQRSDFG